MGDRIRYHSTGEMRPVSLCTGCTHEHLRGGLRSWRPLEGEVTPWSPLEEGAGVCESYRKARNEPRDYWSHHYRRSFESSTLSFSFTNTSQVAPGKSAEVLVVARHLTDYNPWSTTPARVMQIGRARTHDGRMARAQVVVLSFV